MTKRFALYMFAFYTQTGHTVLASADGNMEARLCRWLLMAQDRLRSDVIHLTHETLALTLAIRRPGVTIAIKRLEKMEMIQPSRGTIVIINGPLMLDYVGALYGVPEAEYGRVLG